MGREGKKGEQMGKGVKEGWRETETPRKEPPSLNPE